MRFVLNFNPAGTDALLGSSAYTSLELKKLPKALASGAATKVRLSSSGGRVVTPRDEVGNRFGVVISETEAKTAGLKGGKRYKLVQAGSTGWFNLVPDSNITRSRAKRVDGPGVSVSVIER
jgi:hypothetical protein